MSAADMLSDREIKAELCEPARALIQKEVELGEKKFLADCKISELEAYLK